MRNVDGSFYDFVAERYRGTATRAARRAARRLGRPRRRRVGRAARDAATRFDPDAERRRASHEVLDRDLREDAR